MHHQEKIMHKPEEELGASTGKFEIPFWLKIFTTTLFLLMIFVCALLTYKYIKSPKDFASPKELGLDGIFLFSISAIFMVLIPWGKLGIRISKIGGIEFKDIVAEQASEHAEDISYLEDRIELLESHIRQSGGIAAIIEPFQEPDLRNLLLAFLREHKEWAFSPSRIKAWGAQQQGFSKLSNYDHHFIRSTLQKMVSEKILETRISKKGNTLYRIP